MFIFITRTSPSGTRSWRCLCWNEWDDFPRCRCNAPGVGWYLRNMKKSSRHLTRVRPKRHWHWFPPRILKSYWRLVMSTRVVCPWGVCLPQEERQLVNVSPGTGSTWVQCAMCINPRGPLGTACVNSQSTQMLGCLLLRSITASHGFYFCQKVAMQSSMA